MAKVFHVLTESEKKLINQNMYHPISLARDGFIHLSKTDQILEVIEKFYSHHQKLLLWRINEAYLKDHLKYEAPLEAPNSGILYPHYYKELDIKFVEATFILSKDKDNKFKLPANLLE